MELFGTIGLDFLYFVVPVALALLITAARHFGQRNTVDSFFVANRDVKSVVLATSFAASWIWTLALFVVPQKVYELGVVVLIALVGANAGGLLLLSVLVPKVREYSGNRQLTLPQFVEMRDSKSTGAIYTTGVLGVQIYSVISHTIVAMLLLKFMSDMDRTTMVFFLAGAIIIVAAFRGLQSSIAADVVKYTAVFGIVIVALVATGKSGGIDALVEGAVGIRPTESELFPLKLIWLFVLPVSAALLSAVAMDDQLYQRGFAARENPRRAFVLATFIFAVIPIGLSLTGFLAANKGLGVVIPNTPQGKPDTQLVNVYTIQHILPDFPITLLVAAIITACIGSGGSALHAAGNVGAKNVVQAFWPGLSDGSLVRASRITMVLTLLAGTLIALWNVQLFELWLGWGMFRAVLFFPLLFLIFTRLPSVFSIIVTGLPVTLGSFAFFRWGLGQEPAVASGEAILIAWGLTLAMGVWYTLRNGNRVTKTA